MRGIGLLYVLAILAIVGIVGIAALSSLRSQRENRDYKNQPSAYQANPNTGMAANGANQDSNNGSDAEEAPQGYWQQFLSFASRNDKPIIAIGTALLAAFTALLVAATIALYAAGERANETAKTVQRAFVFIDQFEASILNNQLVILPKWRNSGTTPTRFMTNYVNWKSFIGPMPDNFNFPDLDSAGKEVTGGTRVVFPTFIGPNATIGAEQLTIPTAIMDAVRQGNQRLYVWGWARYEDVFHVRHITRFADEVRFTQVGAVPAQSTPGTQVSVAVTIGSIGRHNCTDEECAMQGIP